MHQRVYRSSTPPLQKASSSSAHAPSPVPAPRDSSLPPLPDQAENEAFQLDKLESLGLQIKEKHGPIQPGEQERLNVLQAKMNDFWTARLNGVARLGHHFTGAYAPDLPNLTAPPSQPGEIVQRVKFNPEETPVTGWAAYHTSMSRDERATGKGRGGARVSQTSEEIMAHAKEVINSGMAEWVRKGGANGLDDIVMVDGALFGVHPPSSGGRQIYPIHRAKIVPKKNQYGGPTGEYTYDPSQPAENTREVFRPRSYSTSEPMDI